MSGFWMQQCFQGYLPILKPTGAQYCVTEKYYYSVFTHSAAGK